MCFTVSTDNTTLWRTMCLSEFKYSRILFFFAMWGGSWRFIMLKLISIVIVVLSFYMALSFFLSKQKDDNIIDIEDYRDRAKLFKRRLPLLIIGITLMLVSIFFLSRLGVNFTAIVQNLLRFLPIIRGLLPLWGSNPSLAVTTRIYAQTRIKLDYLNSQKLALMSKPMN